jgi:imidazolonepropionase-like amidohydrolase
MVMHYLIKPISIFYIAVMLLFNWLSTVDGQGLLIQNINIIDVETGILSENMDVVVNKSVIQSITNSNKENTYPEGMKIINGTSKYLIPGFIDTHIHIAMGTVGFDIIDGLPKLEMDILDEVPDYSLRKLVANGITTARDPGGNTEVTTSVKKQLQDDIITGPELFVAGTIIDTTYFKNLVAQVKTDEDIREEIHTQHREGVDYIKLYTSLNPDQLEVGIDEAHKLGLETIAHLENTSWTEAARRGLDNIVHIIPGSAQLLPGYIRDEFTRSLSMGTQWFYQWFEYVDLDGPEIGEMIRVLKENDVSIDPTLVLFHSVFYANEGIYQHNPALQYVPDSMVENWNTFNFNLGWSDEDYERAHAAWSKVERFTKLLHENGIMLTAGTDTNNPWIPAGESFHRELELLAAAGISNSDVLKIATINGAKLLGIDHRVGTIQKEKEADLVILKRNPLDDISNTRHLDLVIMNGRIFNPEDLVESRYE